MKLLHVCPSSEAQQTIEFPCAYVCRNLFIGCSTNATLIIYVYTQILLSQKVTSNSTIELYYVVFFGVYVVPSAGVVGLEGVNSSSTSLNISWQPPPLEDQNGVIQGYNISYGLTTLDPSQYATETTEELDITLEQLERFTYYTVEVRPFTVVGSGPEENVTVQTDSDRK